MQLSNHAIAQMQQRAISEKTVDYLMAWGRKSYDHRGAIIRYFDKSSRNKLIKHIGDTAAKAMEHQFDTYLVATPECRVITVGHRYQRIYRT